MDNATKQLINLARALYASAEIYVLENPLCFLGSDFEEKIFEDIIGPKGFLKKKVIFLLVFILKETFCISKKILS